MAKGYSFGKFIINLKNVCRLSTLSFIMAFMAPYLSAAPTTPVKPAETVSGPVQKIVIIDSISIPQETFFEAFRLKPSIGRIGKSSDLIPDSGLETEEIVYLNEGEDFFMTSVANEDGELILKEGNKLLNGKWEIRDAFPEDFDLEGDYAFPFMMTDGVTLYFANNGENSMGGYDLFVAQRDPLTGEYLQPSNLGMPFNSDANDFMMAIDEETGVGWWATDRNSDEGEITVFVYLLDDMRKNYPSDTPNLAGFARIDDYKATWEEGKAAEYERILSKLPKKTSTNKKKTKSEFVFPLGNGKEYTTFADFRNGKARELMSRYLKLDKELKEGEASLADMRLKVKKNKSLRASIEELENKIEELRKETKTLKSEILRLEKSVR